MKARYAIVKRTIATVLLFVVLFTCIPAALAESLYFMNSGSNDNAEVYVRIFVPSSKSPSSSLGHYDLMIKGQLHFHGKTFTDPVFSYSTDGALEVFSSEDSGSVYPHSSRSDYYYGNHMYYYHKSFKGLSNVYKFIDTVGDYVKSVHTHPNCSNAFKCSLKGAFSDYSVKYVNCFLAVAKWMKVFGDNTLMNYYTNFYKGDHSSYLPKTIVKKLGSKATKKF